MGFSYRESESAKPRYPNANLSDSPSARRGCLSLDNRVYNSAGSSLKWKLDEPHAKDSMFEELYFTPGNEVAVV
jgi:hypothetical protein